MGVLKGSEVGEFCNNALFFAMKTRSREEAKNKLKNEQELGMPGKGP